MERFIRRIMVVIILFFCIVINVFAADWYYQVGDTGPAGGLIIYDCDADNDSGNQDGLVSSECGWRYLEAAPEDIKIAGKSRFPFGYYRSPSTKEIQFINGTKSYNSENCTGIEVGTGKKNTELLVATMGESAVIDTFFFDTSSYYAAKLCADYEYGGYDDWFLPSIGELILIKGLKDYPKHWSSSEAPNDWGTQYSMAGGYRFSSEESRESECAVRAIRAFSPDPSDNADYSIGSYGPAKGYVFYDKGEYSDGWRYLEVAPEYLIATFGAKVEYSLGHSNDFGDVINPVYVFMGTETAVGTGKQNTEKLVSAMGANAISSIDRFYYTSHISDDEYKRQIEKNVITTSDYAAYLCDNYSLNGYDDWFLPSFEELILIRDNLYLAKKADKLFSQFTKNNLIVWSSSEYQRSYSNKADYSKPQAYCLNFDEQRNYNRHDQDYYSSRNIILFVRAF